MSPATPIYLVLVSCPQAAAESLAEALVNEGLVACVSLLPQLRSIYRWQGQVQRDDESLLLIKTPVAKFGALQQAILARHPYELPEILAVNPLDGHAPYLDWVVASCT